MKSNNLIERNSEIVLRPRFKFELQHSKETLLEAFERVSKSNLDFIISRVDDHVFIKYPKSKQTFWTPQLHLEFNEIDSKSSIVYGLFGPNPTLWLFFMFLHFLLAVVAIGFGVWLYTNWSLGNSFLMQAIVLGSILCIWVLLYVFGRLGRASAKPEMRELNNLMIETILSLDKH